MLHNISHSFHYIFISEWKILNGHLSKLPFPTSKNTQKARFSLQFPTCSSPISLANTASPVQSTLPDTPWCVESLRCTQPHPPHMLTSPVVTLGPLKNQIFSFFDWNLATALSLLHMLWFQWNLVCWNGLGVGYQPANISHIDLSEHKRYSKNPWPREQFRRNFETHISQTHQLRFWNDNRTKDAQRPEVCTHTNTAFYQHLTTH